MSFQEQSAARAANTRLAILDAEVRYARERLALYKAKAYGPRATSAKRLRELERACKSAESRLRSARDELSD
jgi:hypothetical protein